VVNEALARAFWPDGQAIDRWIAYAPDSTGTNLHRRVIGVIADVRHGGPMSEAGPEVYEVHRQTTEIWRWFGRSMAFVAHTRDGRVLPIDRVRDAVRAIDPSLPVTAHSSLDAVLGRSVASPRFNGVLLGSFAGLALLLAAIGLYGVLAFSVRQRRREVGVRIALGALRGTVLRAVLLDALRLVAIGSVVGVGVAVALGKTLETFVLGLPPTDPLTYVTVIVVLACVALAAAALPAWRAASVDPVISLREE
jgi:ABC-type antimicrobial peptide transport system permease subunit